MLARSQGLRLDHNRENPGAAGPHHLPTKTPARALPGKSVAGPAPTTGGKGLLHTAKGGRVLGAKDRNGGQRDTNEPPALLFPGKPSTSQAGPSCAPTHTFKTPAARKTLRPAVEMVTPATGVRPRHASNLMLATPSPDVSMEVDEEQKQEEEDVDREVEYAGASARDYDEPFIPDHPEPDYKTAGFGAALRGMSFSASENAADWAERDALERRLVQIELDEGPEKPMALTGHSPTSEPLFPAPVRRRAPLTHKPINLLTSSSASRTGTAPRVRPTSSMTTSSTASSRKPPSASASLATNRTRPTPTSSTAPTSRPLTSGRSAGSASSSRLGGLASTKPSLSASTARKPASSSSLASAPGSTLSRPRPPPPLCLSRPASSGTLRTGTSMTSKASVTSPSLDSGVEKEVRQQERELGIFGVVDEDDNARLLDFAEASMEHEAFKFDLEL
ncbi:hypothetical protein JCM8097_005349 [Rhodosporidiobolus ruineniae]